MRALFTNNLTKWREANPSADSANPPRLGLHPHSTLASEKRIFTPRNTVSRSFTPCERSFSGRATQSHIIAHASGERGALA